MQAWVKFWFDDEKRLRAAKALQLARSSRIKDQWLKPSLGKDGFLPDERRLSALLHQSEYAIERASDIATLLIEEARLTKALFKLASETVGYGDFTRSKNWYRSCKPFFRSRKLFGLWPWCYCDLGFGNSSWIGDTARENTPRRVGV
ncbi:CRISPR-associated endonuclease Cas1 [Zymomonas mobilis]|uniref:hypothetical protein n=1 Tax=Zymomonas mobilis TaxID=542 RepID=UPI0021C40A2E|nr:hypothetical protein [Zymomonas mobilis]